MPPRRPRDPWLDENYRAARKPKIAVMIDAGKALRAARWIIRKVTRARNS